jgi:uncharacterized protein YceH (UPF0502 family)
MQESRRHDDLTAQEVRVLACLIEKEATVPGTYPLTLNSLRTACNQSTSRDPVVSYTDHEVERALGSLRERGLTRTVHSTSNRAMKYRHVLADALSLDERELALMSVLMLRGPQTLGELKSRAERQHPFDSIDSVAAALASLAARQRPLALQLDRRHGHKDARWVHLLSGIPADDDRPPDSSLSANPMGSAPDGSTAGDPYGEATAEFYDLLATGHWEEFGLQLLDLLSGADPALGPIVDLGAGTGVGMPSLRIAVADARIHAIEPSRAMRTALHTRLSMDAGLRQVTTVDPRSLADAVLPDRACALVASATLGHLSDSERQRLWRFIAERMPPGAPAVIEVLPPERPLQVPPTRYRQLVVGEHVYEGWQEGEPADELHMAWTMTYRVLRGESLVAEYTARSRWRCFSVDDIRAEIAPFGLNLAEHRDCVVISS